jgi:transcriptional regulator with XRE-family HTH domain
MSSLYTALLRRLREQHALSQVHVAAVLKVSRATYIAIEQGHRELSLRDAITITTLYGITLDNLVAEHIPNEPKYAEMIQSLLRFAADDKYVLKKTKLAKLLYITDFSWYYVHHKSMSGVSYRHTPLGPTPDILFRLLDDLEFAGVIAITQVVRDDYHMYEISETRTALGTPLKLLTARELDHIRAIWQTWSKATTAEILKFTTEQIPYQQTNPGAIIPYELIRQAAPHEIS